MFDSLASVISSRSARIPAQKRLLRATTAVLAAVALSFGAAGAAAQAPALGQPDMPPVDAPPPPVAIPEPTPPPVASPAPAGPSAAPATTPAVPASAAPSAGDAAAAAAAQARRKAALARRKAAAQAAAISRIGDGVGANLDIASTGLERWGSTSERAVESARATAVSGTSAASGAGRESTLALLLLALSGATAAVALLPLRAIRMGGHRSTLSFVERHRLELAGISTSCLLVALLVFAGLI